MIGYIGFSPSYGETLQYCLSNKRGQPSSSEGENRAEVLYYNLCYGDKDQLVQQFKRAQKANINICKPVLHLAISLSPEDKVKKSRLVDIAKDCARALDFDKHQYLAILHKDTAHPHMHLVVNRVGFDGHTVVNQFMLRKVNTFCRDSEVKYDLKRVPAIRWYRAKAEKMMPSDDKRVIKLKNNIRWALTQVANYEEFQVSMQR